MQPARSQKQLRCLKVAAPPYLQITDIAEQSREFLNPRTVASELDRLSKLQAQRLGPGEPLRARGGTPGRQPMAAAGTLIRVSSCFSISIRRSVSTATFWPGFFLGQPNLIKLQVYMQIVMALVQVTCVLLNKTGRLACSSGRLDKVELP